MTAEIVIMNKSAIALAADSAVTVRTDAGPKIYNTANKLFKLSDTQPVGLMIYDMASFLRVPWEIIIKEYRKHLGTDAFDHLEDYSADFISFINKHDVLFPKEEQEKNFLSSISSYYNLINNEIKKAVQNEIQIKGKRLTNRKISTISSTIINSYYLDLTNRDFLPNNSKKHIKEIIKIFSPKIESEIEKIFEQLPIYKKNVTIQRKKQKEVKKDLTGVF